jgi:hypothetical protein
MSNLRVSATIIVLRVFRCAVRWLCFMLDVSDGACRWRQLLPLRASGPEVAGCHRFPPGEGSPFVAACW